MMLEVMEDGARWGFKPKSSPYSYFSITNFLFLLRCSYSISLCCFRWEQVVDLTYSLRLGAKPRPMEQDEAAVEKLRYELGSATVGDKLLFLLTAQTAVSCRLGREGARQAGCRPSFFDPLAWLPLALPTQ